MFGSFEKPKDKLSEELERLEKTKADLERKARELEVSLNIPPQPPKVEEQPRVARFLDLDENDTPITRNPELDTARLKVEQRKAKQRVLILAGIVIVLLLIIVRMIS